MHLCKTANYLFIRRLKSGSEYPKSTKDIEGKIKLCIRIDNRNLMTIAVPSCMSLLLKMWLFLCYHISCMTEAKSFPILQMFNGLRLETKCGSFGCTMTKLFLRLILKTYRRLLNKRNSSINIFSILTNDTWCIWYEMSRRRKCHHEKLHASTFCIKGWFRKRKKQIDNMTLLLSIKQNWITGINQGAAASPSS